MVPGKPKSPSNANQRTTSSCSRPPQSRLGSVLAQSRMRECPNPLRLSCLPVLMPFRTQRPNASRCWEHDRAGHRTCPRAARQPSHLTPQIVVKKLLVIPSAPAPRARAKNALLCAFFARCVDTARALQRRHSPKTNKLILLLRPGPPFRS